MKVAIIDHFNHKLIIDEINDDVLDNYSSVEDYISDNYTFEGSYSWDSISRYVEYIPDEDDKEPVNIDIYEVYLECYR